MSDERTDVATPESAPAPTSEVGRGRGNDLKPATVALLVILIGIGVAASVAGWQPNQGGLAPRSAVSLRPPSWRATPAELSAIDKAAHARRAVKVDDTSKGLAALLEAYRTYNATDLAARGNTKSPSLQDAYANYQASAREYFRFKGEEAFLAVGQRLLDDFGRALRSRDDKAVEALSGGFVSQALTIGLMRGAYHPTKDAIPVIKAAFLLRWVSVLASERTVDGLVAAAERLLLLRFKVGLHRTLPPERRMALGRLLRRLQPNFPTDELLASRFASERRWSLAARFYRRALKGRENDERLRANVAYCDEQAALFDGGGTPKAP